MNSMRPDAISMSRPDINENDISLVISALRSGVLSIGPFVEQFEDLVRNYIGTRYAVAVSNGTSGLHLCMRLAGVSEGSEVITSPFSFVASANCILYERGTPVFVDIDEETLNIDPAAVDAAVTGRTVGILPIHVFGRPAAMDSLCETADRHSLVLIEDACEALGAIYRNRNVGTFGRASVFAFYPNKQMTTGEGAIIATDDPAWDASLRSLRNQGRGTMGGWLSHDKLGFNYRLNELSAALGVSQLSRFEELLERRAAVAARYGERLSAVPGVRTLMPVEGTTRMSWFVYVVRLDSSLDRDAVATRLASKGIPTRNYFPPIHLQPYFREQFGFRPGQFPVTERVAVSTLALPFHTNLGDRDIERVCTALSEAVDETAGRR
ncbi:MAG: DegT/DnrJ/EryC1/StrS family aminotransferase [Bradyrhizobium sp.]|nr:DegT/DnrJ/EryC1/StrS family aminotransferase [Bradyrhizobium sp.]